MTVILFDLSAIEAELASIGVPVAEMCRRAGIETSTWQRWKSERFSPQQSTARKVVAAMQGIRSERAPAEAAP